MYSSNVKFYLHSPKSDTPTAIYAKVRLNRKEVKIMIGKKIHAELWDTVTQRPTKDKNLLNHWKKHHPTIKIELGNIEARINRVKELITTRINVMEHSDEKVTGTLLRQHVQEKLGLVEKQVTNQSIIDYTERYIKDIESGKRLTAKKSRYKDGTIKNYTGFISQLRNFQKGYRKILRFEDVSLEMYDNFVEFFQDKAYSPNTIGRLIKTFKIIMRSAEEEGLHSNRVYTDKRFYLITAPVDSIYLTDEEIDKIKNLDLADKPKHDQVRDIFLLGTQTALRFSDYGRIRPHHIQENGDESKLIIEMQKTEQKVTIPLNSLAKEILNKYNYYIPHVTVQILNGHIKEIGKWAGIDQPIEVTKYRGSEKTKEVLPKYELISSHTARRSAATNMLKSGLDLDHVRRITGHTTFISLIKYIKLTEDEVYDGLKKAEFFKR